MASIHRILIGLAVLLLRAGTGIAEPATIGALAELTGNFARIGADCRTGYEIAQSIASPRSRVIFGDNQSDPKVGISEFHRLVDTEKAGLVVTSRSPVGLALNPLSAQQKIPLVGIVGHPRFVSENPYAVRVFPSAEVEAGVLATSVIDKGFSRIAIVSVEDDYFLGLQEVFTKKVGVEKIVFSESIAPSEQDFSSVLLRIRSKGADVILVNVAPHQIVNFVRRLKESRVTSSIYTNFTAGLADIRKALGKEGDGIVFAELDYQKPAFLKAVQAKSGSSETSPIGYACSVALLFAIEAVKVSSANNIPIAEAIELVREVQTLDGPILFVGREAKFQVLLKMLRNGLVVSTELKENA